MWIDRICEMERRRLVGILAKEEQDGIMDAGLLWGSDDSSEK